MKTKCSSFGFCLVMLLLATTEFVFSQANNNLSNLDSTTINRALIPQFNNLLDIGTSLAQWKDLHLGGSLYLRQERVLTTLDDGNLFIGPGAGESITEGEENTFIGEDAGRSFIEGEYNTFVGADAGSSFIEGEYNTFMGTDAGNSMTGGEYNTFIGSEAGFSTLDAEYNTFLGYLVQGT